MKSYVISITGVIFLFLTAAMLSADEPVRKRHLFLDPGFAAVRENVTIGVNPPKSREIVIRRDTPAEAHMIGLYLTVIDEGDKIRMWYSGRFKPGSSQGAYAESTDGVRWDKPSLGLFKLPDQSPNHLYGQGISQEGSVFVDPNARSEAERYVFVSSRFKSGGLYRYTSADGIRNWKMDEKPFLPFECDSQNVCFWDANLKKYVLFLRGWHQKTGRKVVRYETGDIAVPSGIVPTERKNKFPRDPERDPFIVEEIPTVLQCDEKDPPETDIYTNAVQPYPPDPTWYVGFPSFFRHDEDSPLKKHATDGFLETQFVASQDGIRWERFDRAVYAGLGLRNEENAGMIFMGVGLIVRGDEIWQYAAEFKTTHGNVPGRAEMGDGVICRYVQRIDGFVSLDFPTVGTGRCVTRPVTVTEPKMLVNLDAGALGELKVGLLDEKGKEIPGFGSSDSLGVRANDTGAVARWKNKSDLTELLGRPVQIELSGSRTKLYSIRFEKP